MTDGLLAQNGRAEDKKNPTQGADAYFLLTYAPEMEQGGWEMEGKAGNITGRRRQEEEGVNLDEQGENRR